jgi:hypothetical protein
MGKKRQNGFMWLLFGGGVFLLLAGLASVLSNRQSQPDVTPTPAFLAQVPRVSLQDARNAYDEGTAVFLDVRIGESYSFTHPNAVSIPAAELTSRLGS